MPQQHRDFDNQKHLSYSLEESSRLAREWLDSIKHAPSLILLQGPIGAGKSCFVKFCLKHLNLLQSDQDFSSPSYSLINEYSLANEGTHTVKSLSSVYHIDFYRILNKSDVIELDLIQDKKSMYFFEWPERVDNSFFKTFDMNMYRICFEIVSETRRYLSFTRLA